MRHRFQTSQWVPYPSAFVFSFFADPHNLPPLMPHWQRARIDSAQIIPPPHPSDMPPSSDLLAGNGSVLLITFRAFPLSPFRLSWRAVISNFIWNDHFCDEQQRGPFAHWKHCHVVREESRDGIPGTTVTDEVSYQFRMGAAGDLANALFFRRRLAALFRYRQARLPGLLEDARRKPGWRMSDSIRAG